MRDEISQPREEERLQALYCNDHSITRHSISQARLSLIIHTKNENEVIIILIEDIYFLCLCAKSNPRQFLIIISRQKRHHGTAMDGATAPP